MRLSVVMCTYNGVQYVQEQIMSILHQTVPVDEIIVCDDGSSDETVDVVKSTFESNGFKNYTIISDGGHYGVSSNFLRGMKAATGDYVFTSDQDDVWCDDKVEVFRAAMSETKRELYFSDGFVVESDLTKRPYTLWESLHFSVSDLASTSILGILLSRCVVTGAAMAVSKQLVEKVDSIPSSWLHDGWFAMVAACDASIEPIDRKTFLYRQHGSNVIGARSSSFIGRTRSWLVNRSAQPEVRQQRLNRYECVRDMLGFDSPELDDCILFWSKLNDLGGRGRIRDAATVLSLFLDGSYDKFYTGVRGALRDILWLFQH